MDNVKFLNNFFHCAVSSRVAAEQDEITSTRLDLSSVAVELRMMAHELEGILQEMKA